MKKPPLTLTLPILVKFLFSITLILSACQTPSIEQKSTTSSPSSTITSSSPEPATIEPELMISDNGIGQAKLGMTLGQLKQLSSPDTEFKLESPFMVDINAIAVSQSGVVQYYILYVAGTTSHPDGITPTDTDPITSLMTKNPNYQTPEGVKAGMRLEAVEAIYGNALLSYNTENESREYVAFSQRSAGNIRFRPQPLNSGFAGIYPDSSEPYRTTEEFHDSATISIIEVACAPINCP